MGKVFVSVKKGAEKKGANYSFSFMVVRFFIAGCVVFFLICFNPYFTGCFSFRAAELSQISYPSM